MLCVVGLTRTYELYGLDAAVTICMHIVLLRLAKVVGLPLLLLAVVVSTCAVNTFIKYADTVVAAIDIKICRHCRRSDRLTRLRPGFEPCSR